MKYGLWMSRAHPAQFAELTVEAERLGFESVWMSEHLVMPVTMTGSPLEGEEHPPVPPTLPIFDTCAYLSYLAGLTSRIRLGTWVYLLGYRHPIVAARSMATVDILSNGRTTFGLGAGWLREEGEALGLDWPSRGRRLDEAMEICRQLWTDKEVEWHGKEFDFPPVMFEPKPVQRGGPPLLVGGESPAALHRVARLGDGWIAMAHSPESIQPFMDALDTACAAVGRRRADLQIVVGCPSVDDLDPRPWEDMGVDCLIVGPWASPSRAMAGIRDFAETHLNGAGE